MIIKISFRKSPENDSTICPEIPEKIIPTKIEISKLIIMETKFWGNLNTDSNTPTTIIRANTNDDI